MIRGGSHWVRLRGVGRGEMDRLWRGLSRHAEMRISAKRPRRCYDDAVSMLGVLCCLFEGMRGEEVGESSREVEVG